jgi:hypothetical protein
LRPMTRPRQTWREKRLAREENSTDSNDSHDEFKIGESSSMKVDVESTAQPTLDINMVFVIPKEFRAQKTEVAELCAGIKRAVFERSGKPGERMKHYILEAIWTAFQ